MTSEQCTLCEPCSSLSPPSTSTLRLKAAQDPQKMKTKLLKNRSENVQKYSKMKCNTSCTNSNSSYFTDAVKRSNNFWAPPFSLKTCLKTVKSLFFCSNLHLPQAYAHRVFQASNALKSHVIICIKVGHHSKGGSSRHGSRATMADQKPTVPRPPGRNPWKEVRTQNGLFCCLCC